MSGINYTSLSNALDNGLTVKQYYEQFGTVVLKLDKEYVAHPRQWQEAIYKIFYIGKGVALGEVIKSGIEGKVGDVSMFHATGLRVGWRHNDNRYQYRLQNIK